MGVLAAFVFPLLPVKGLLHALKRKRHKVNMQSSRRGEWYFETGVIGRYLLCIKMILVQGFSDNIYYDLIIITIS